MGVDLQLCSCMKQHDTIPTLPRPPRCRAAEAALLEAAWQVVAAVRAATWRLRRLAYRLERRCPCGPVWALAGGVGRLDDAIAWAAGRIIARLVLRLALVSGSARAALRPVLAALARSSAFSREEREAAGGCWCHDGRAARDGGVGIGSQRDRPDCGSAADPQCSHPRGCRHLNESQRGMGSLERPRNSPAVRCFR